MVAVPTASIEAAGDINPSRFITGSGNHRAVESNAGDTKVIGVSQEGAKEAPQSGSSALAAADNDHFQYFPWGSEALLTMDATGCTAFDYLKPDNEGKGDVAGSGDVAFALALETAAGGEKVRVLVMSPFQLP